MVLFWCSTSACCVVPALQRDLASQRGNWVRNLAGRVRVHCFNTESLDVAHPGCAAADVCKELELAQPAVVRHLQRLGAGSQNSKNVGRGLGLIRHVDDPKDTRRRLYFLTDEGLRLLRLLSQWMPKSTKVKNLSMTTAVARLDVDPRQLSLMDPDDPSK